MRTTGPRPHSDGEGHREGLVAVTTMEAAMGEPNAATAEATEMSAAEGGRPRSAAS